MFLKNLFSGGKQGIGVELTPERLNIARLKKQGQGYKLANLISVEMPENVIQEGQIVNPPELVELLQSVMAEHKLKVKTVATAISGRDVVTRLIPVPAELDDRELREMVLNQEAGLYLPFPREEADVDYQKLGFLVDEDGIEKVQVLLVATRKDVTDTYLSTFREAGLQVDVLEITSFALIRTIRPQLRQFSSQEAVAIVDIEYDYTEISIVVDGVPQFSRTVPIGTFQIQNSLSRAMNLPPSRNTELLQGMTVPLNPLGGMGGSTTAATNHGAAAMLRVLGELADELRRSIDFYLNQDENLEVAQLLIAGPGGGLGQIDEFFTQRLSLPSSAVDPIESLSLQVHEEISELQRPSLGIVLGLGLREV
ncbi:MAG: type IV pilus assembly protein PilM [Prochlorotrichaceae cyanobacterium]